MAMFGKGSRPRHSGQPYIDPQKAGAVLENRGKLSFPELLRCRVRYFSDGAVLGGLMSLCRISLKRSVSILASTQSRVRTVCGEETGVDLRCCGICGRM